MIRDKNKTKDQLINELSLLRRQVADLEQSQTDLRQMQNELRQANNIQSLILSNTVMGIGFVRNRIFEWSNSRLADMLGRTPQQVCGSGTRILYLSDEAYEEAGRIIYPALKTGKWFELEILVLRADKTTFTARIVGKALNPVNPPDGAIWILEDITSRKQTEENLRESEEKYRTVVEEANEGIIITQDACFAYVNPKMANDILGVPAAELVGKPFWDYIHPLDREMVARRHQRKQAGEILPDSYEFRIIGKENKLKWVCLTARKTQWNGRPASINMFADVTERREAEESLRNSEAAIRSVFKATPVGLCVVKDRVLQSTNKAWQENTGYSEADIVGHTTRMFYENDAEYERVGRELYSSLAKRDFASVQTKFRRQDGALRDAIITAAPFKTKDSSSGIVIAVEDITARRQTEDELNEHRRQLADIIDFLPDATLVVNSDGVVIAWNRAMESLTGVKKENMLGKGNYEYALPFHGERCPVLIDYVLHPEKEMGPHYTSIQRICNTLYCETLITNLPRGDVYVSASASVLRDKTGRITAAIECIRDNTERMKLAGRLNRAEKMEALGTLAGGVAHDLNNVVGVTVGYAELLAQMLPPESTPRRYADSILQSSMRGAVIIQDLLTLARRGVTVAEVVDLNSLVSYYLQAPEFEKLKSYHPQVIIAAELEDGLLNIKGSSIHLGKTITNLVFNAAESISGSGRVTIRTENRYLDHPIKGYDEMKEGDYVVLTVSDTGSGISARDLPKIFEPFYTKKVMGKSGTGLGLAVVWGTVKDHDGYIDVQSEEGRGSTFSLYFPVTRESLARAHAVSTETYKGKGEAILVVDDVQEQRELAKNMLVNLGYQAEAVAGGEKALEYLKNKKADLIVLDMIMEPGIDGMETYRRVLQIHPGQKAVIVSGFSETDRVRNAQEIGAGTFVRKPYVLEKIGLAVRNELDRQ